jgi:hypothetical protein
MVRRSVLSPSLGEKVLPLTLCRRVVNLIKYALVPGRFKFFEYSTPKCTIWLRRLVSYTYWQTHSQNGAWENDKSRDRASKRVTEKATLVVARLQCVNVKCSILLTCQHPYSKLHWITYHKAAVFKIAAGRESNLTIEFTSHKIHTHNVCICAEGHAQISTCQTKQEHNTHFFLWNISKRGVGQAFAGSTARGKPWVRGSPWTYWIITIVFGPFGVDSVLLTEGNILKSGCTNANYYRGDYRRLCTFLNQNVYRSKSVIK